MFEFLFKKQFKEFELTKTELYSLRSRVHELEKNLHELNVSIEKDKKADRNLHEINSSDIKDLTQRIVNLEKLLQNEPKKTRKPRAKKTVKENTNE